MTEQMLIARAVREAAQQVFPRQYTLYALRGKCHVTSFALWVLWRGAGIESRFVQGAYEGPGFLTGTPIFGDAGFIDAKRGRRQYGRVGHLWVETDREIWDLTLTQFDPYADHVSVIRRPDGRYHAEREFKDYDSAWGGLALQGIDHDAADIMDRAVKILPDMEIAA